MVTVTCHPADVGNFVYCHHVVIGLGIVWHTQIEGGIELTGLGIHVGTEDVISTHRALAIAGKIERDTIGEHEWIIVVTIGIKALERTHIVPLATGHRALVKFQQAILACVVVREIDIHTTLGLVDVTGHTAVIEVLGTCGQTTDILTHAVHRQEFALVDDKTIDKADLFCCTYERILFLAELQFILNERTHRLVAGVLYVFLVVLHNLVVSFLLVVDVAQVTVGIDILLGRSSNLKHWLDIDGIVGLDTADCIPIVILGMLWIIPQQFLAQWLCLDIVPCLEIGLYLFVILGYSPENSEEREQYYQKYLFHKSNLQIQFFKCTNKKRKNP